MYFEKRLLLIQDWYRLFIKQAMREDNFLNEWVQNKNVEFVFL